MTEENEFEEEYGELVYCIDCKNAFKCHDREYLLANPGHDVFCNDFISNQSNDPQNEDVKVPSERSRSSSNQSLASQDEKSNKPIPLCAGCYLPSVDKCGGDCNKWFCLHCLESHDCRDHESKEEK